MDEIEIHMRPGLRGSIYCAVWDGKCTGGHDSETAARLDALEQQRAAMPVRLTTEQTVASWGFRTTHDLLEIQRRRAA